MDTLRLVVLAGSFAGLAALMLARVLPALVVLPLMALATALAGGVAPGHVCEYVLGQGVTKLHAAYTVTLLGSMLSVVLQKTGVAESLVKKGAELSGDDPWAIAVGTVALVALLFTTLSGLGAIIMVATVVLPILASVGVGPTTCVGVFLFGLSIGGTLNAANWAVYTNVMGLPVSTVRGFALVMFMITFIAALVYVTLRLRHDGEDVPLPRALARGGLLVVAVGALLAAVAPAGPSTAPSGTAGLARWAVGLALALAFVRAAAGAVRAGLAPSSGPADEVRPVAYLSTLVPLVLILTFEIHFVAAFVIGLAFAFLATYRPGRLGLFIQSLFEGGALAMPAVVLMFGIGMLLVAIMGPGGKIDAYPSGWPVTRLIQPLLASLVPSGPVAYVLVFTLAAPLALYRGPLNVWGMGYGLAAIFMSSGLPPAAVMGLLMAVGQVQGISDPTNTHNVWLANEMRVDVQRVLWNTLPYTWAVALAGLAVSALLFVRP